MKISITDVKQNLYSRYDVICFVDIAELVTSHKKIFETLDKHRKDAFSPDEKIILYSSEYLNQTLLDHIQRAAAKIDISNFFILICNNQDISEKLKLSNEKYGYDDTQIQSETINLDETKKVSTKNIFKFDTMCAFPFSMAMIGQSNTMRPCCKFDGSIGNLDKDDFLASFYGDRINAIRNEMKHGKRPVECNTCWENEDSGTTSFRQLGLLKYEKSLDYGWLDDTKIRDLTISPSNICNFKCRICDHYSSSAIATEKIKNSDSEKEIKKIKDILKYKLSDNKKNKILNILDQSAETIEFLHILGGEPFLYPHLEETLDTLIEKGYAKNIALEFNSNGSVFPEHLINKFNKFKSVEILLSIDDIGKRFEIQRGDSWATIYKNIQKFVNMNYNNISIKMAVTVNIQNLMYLDEIYRFFNSIEIDIIWWYLEHPYHYCIDNINKKTQTKVIEKYSQHPEKELRNIAERVKSNTPVLNNKFLEECKKYDTIRNQSFFKYHKEIVDLMAENQFDDQITKY